jgi:hypothetical protein
MRFLPLMIVAVVAVGCGKPSSDVQTKGSTPLPSPDKTPKTAPIAGEVKTKDGRLSLVPPKGWTVIDPTMKDIKSISDKITDPKMAQMLLDAAGQVQLMVMDFTKMGTGFADNLNVVDSGPATVRNDADLESLFGQLQKQFGDSKMQHKIVKYPVGSTLSYWGTIKQPGGGTNDLLGYAFEGNGTGYVITFSSASGKIETIRSACEAVMQTVRIN